MIIRDATAADLPQIIDIYNAAIPGRRATADTEPITVASCIAWLRNHDPLRHPLWVVADRTRIDGWLSFEPSHGRTAYHATAELSIYVSPQRHRTGIGRTLISRAVESAPRFGLKALLGFIFGHNEASLRLFGGLGFERWGSLPCVAGLDGVERDLVIVGRRPGG